MKHERCAQLTTDVAKVSLPCPTLLRLFNQLSSFFNQRMQPQCLVEPMRPLVEVKC